MSDTSSHFVCTGSCAGVAGAAQNCETQGCSNHGQPLVECGCSDEAHTAAADESDA